MNESNRGEESILDAVAASKSAFPIVPANGPSYEQQMNRDRGWALSEGSRHFEENSNVFQALRKIAKRLNALEIPYAVVGGMALFQHGFRRFTEHVEILATKESLKKIHEHLDGLGYVPPFEKSKNLRDTQTGVKIEFLITGEYPGDGKRKPVSFPDPSTVAWEVDGVRYITLPKLIELKLASGMTGVHRFGDLSDVLKLIKAVNIPSQFEAQLDPYVREKFNELWKQACTRYVRQVDKKSLGEMASPKTVAELLDQMRYDRVSITDIPDNPECLRLETTDASSAQKYGMVDESEYWYDQDSHDSTSDGLPGK